ncbi:unnamed protein product [Thlaspi arvense]|uniref:Amidase domain-containing protein n=1 Tax=Thlaspi arvense TaxID=13288 RepID=A0AAU9SYP5_THLAR|nr:unnamed protein product [Thlaspi arvense]
MNNRVMQDDKLKVVTLPLEKLTEIAYAFEQWSKIVCVMLMAELKRIHQSTLAKDKALLVQSGSYSQITPTSKFSIQEATVDDIRLAFEEKRLTSKQLVEMYLESISKLNPLLHAVIETNPDALIQAEIADRERELKDDATKLPVLHGVPVLLKDSISTKDRLNTTAGSLALLGSVVAQDAGVVKRLREHGAVILGKASLSEWAHFRSFSIPNGWSARGLQGKNPYVLSADPCGSSSGSAISVAANLVAVSIGTETDGSILCPASQNSVVGIKPSVGLTSRAGVVPISLRQDTVGTVSDAVHLLDAIVGYDHLDEATKTASEFIPKGGYKQFLKASGLKGKRLGIVMEHSRLDQHIKTLRREGAIVIDNLTIPNIEAIGDGEATALLAEFKTSLNVYLQELVNSPVRSLADVIAFNDKFAEKEKVKEWGQEVFLAAEATNGMGEKEKAALQKMEELSRDGIEKLMKEKELDAIVALGSTLSSVLAIGGYPGINVPAGYDTEGVPFGITFGGLRFSEPKLIEIAYGFEQATLIRKPPKFTTLRHLQISHSHIKPTSTLSIEEATVDDIRLAFEEKRLTSKQLVELYLESISKLNPMLHAVIETNPDALIQAEIADKERELKDAATELPILHGVPVLLKDSISSKDKLNTTAGSLALLGSVVARDAGVVKRLRESGAVILGKASLSEWAYFRSNSIPNGWSARGLQGKNPYVLSADTGGSSSGSAISVAANLVAVSLGTETDGSILSPASHNSVVGIKPSVGLTSRAGVVPISLRQDTVGPICRTVSDAVHLLDAIVGYDPLDEATKAASEFIPEGGYRQFLKPNGLKGKRLGIVMEHSHLDQHIKTLRRDGAIVIDNLKIPNMEVIMDWTKSGEETALLAEFKISLNEYLQELVKSPVRSLADEKVKEWGQEVFLAAEATNGMGEKERAALHKMEELSRNGIEKLMKENKLDAIVTLGKTLSPVLATGGYPGITVPAGYDSEGVPFGITFGGLRFSEPKLIEIAYGFEQATLIRKPPKFTT